MEAWLELLGADPVFTLPPEVLRLRVDRLRRLVQRRPPQYEWEVHSEPRLAIKEVAQRLNFSSEFHFSRFFHRGAGMSPTQFRERSRA